MKIPINDGGPAFPVSSTDPLSGVTEPIPGMSLRDYFAAKAMQGFIAKYGLDLPFQPSNEASPMPQLARFSVEAADELLAALNLAPGRDSK